MKGGQSAVEQAGDGWALAWNLVAFARALRRAGVPVAPARVAEAVRALTWVDLAERRQVFHALRAVLVTRREDLALFETLFNLFWRHPDDQLSAARRPTRSHAPPRRGSFTLAALPELRARGLEETGQEGSDRAGTYSREEQLQRKRFSEMTPEELEEAGRLISRVGWRVSRRRTRRWIPDASGESVDLRRVLREAGRLGYVPGRLARRRRKDKPRPVVFIADVSGSMERYARLILRFSHVVVTHMPRVEVFVFGTRLSRITPHLHLRNVDRALDEAVRTVVDWAGGTRIGECLGEFNRRWGRRVLRRGAVVVLISDGCDRGDVSRLRREMHHLQLRCHRLIWLNPYAGRADYEVRVAGMSAALPFVDDFLPIHDVAAMGALSEALAGIA